MTGSNSNSNSNSNSSSNLPQTEEFSLQMKCEPSHGAKTSKYKTMGTSLACSLLEVGAESPLRSELAAGTNGKQSILDLDVEETLAKAILSRGRKKPVEVEPEPEKKRRCDLRWALAREEPETPNLTATAAITPKKKDSADIHVNFRRSNSLDDSSSSGKPKDKDKDRVSSGKNDAYRRCNSLVADHCHSHISGSIITSSGINNNPNKPRRTASLEELKTKKNSAPAPPSITSANSNSKKSPREERNSKPTINRSKTHETATVATPKTLKPQPAIRRSKSTGPPPLKTPKTPTASRRSTRRSRTTGELKHKTDQPSTPKGNNSFTNFPTGLCASETTRRSIRRPALSTAAKKPDSIAQSEVVESTRRRLATPSTPEVSSRRIRERPAPLSCGGRRPLRSRCTMADNSSNNNHHLNNKSSRRARTSVVGDFQLRQALQQEFAHIPTLNGLDLDDDEDDYKGASTAEELNQQQQQPDLEEDKPKSRLEELQLKSTKSIRDLQKIDSFRDLRKIDSFRDLRRASSIRSLQDSMPSLAAMDASANNNTNNTDHHSTAASWAHSTSSILAVDVVVGPMIDAKPTKKKPRRNTSLPDLLETNQRSFDPFHLHTKKGMHDLDSVDTEDSPDLFASFHSRRSKNKHADNKSLSSSKSGASKESVMGSPQQQRGGGRAGGEQPSTDWFQAFKAVIPVAAAN